MKMEKEINRVEIIGLCVALFYFGLGVAPLSKKPEGEKA